MESESGKVQLIVECTSFEDDKNPIFEMAELKYRIPCINSYVIEVDKKNLPQLRKLTCVKAVHQNTHITAQLNKARETVSATEVQKKGYNGEGIGVCILDTGIAPMYDFVHPRNRIIAFKDFINNKSEPYDDNGHGTHVAGIAAGNGWNSNGEYKGIAPDSNLIILKTLNYEGKGELSDVLAGIQWLIDNQKKYNIRVANLSIGTDNTSSNDPLVRAVEEAWDRGIAITIAAGNNGPNFGSVTSPGISKKAITVGASDDCKESTGMNGEALINFSGRGPTAECIVKPNLIAPGTNVVSCLCPTPYDKANIKPIKKSYFTLSGTSMATPIVTGAIALLLQKNHELRPDDIKLMLKKCCTDLNYPPNQQGWGLININKLISEEVAYARK